MVFALLVGALRAAGFFLARACDEPAFVANAADRSYASCIQSVSGASTSSRCLIWMRCATLDFETRSTRRTCGAFSGPAEEDAEFEEALLRSNEEVAGLAREHDRIVGRVDALFSKGHRGSRADVPRRPEDPRRGPASARPRWSSSSRAPLPLRPTVCSGSTLDQPCSIVATNRLTADSPCLAARLLSGLRRFHVARA